MRAKEPIQQLLGRLCLATVLISPLGHSADSGREDFERAWQAASRGDHKTLKQLMPNLRDYALYPYLRYEDLRVRRSTVSAQEMSAFLSSHEDWAFTAGLRTTWLRTLGQQKKWSELLQHGPGSNDIRVRCYLSRARIASGQHEGLLNEVQSLWAAGQSQPDECDPAFEWLKQQHGITQGLAWMRIRLAVEARNARMIRYLSRFLPADQRKWADYWYQQEREGYRRLDRAAKWPDSPHARDIVRYGLAHLARTDADRAASFYARLSAQFTFSEDDRSFLLRELAIWSAVERSPHSNQRVQAVPKEHRDGQLLEWWARYGLTTKDWASVVLAVAEMPGELKSDGRWRYWDARARLHLGDPDFANSRLSELSVEASYYGFLAADFLQRPYAICPQAPSVTADALQEFRLQSGLGRALELRQAGLPSWARREWNMLTNRLEVDGLRLAAALAVDEGWHEMAIFALGNSGDQRWYEWRFPVHHRALVEQMVTGNTMDTSWVLGLIRSESAMAEDAISSAGARGLMQVMPDTAKRLARKHGLHYGGKQQLLQAQPNIRFGTLYLQTLLDQFEENPVLATGAYNAGPKPVKRWLTQLPLDDTAVWIETLSYFETRDYIPRVLAFATIYDWRLQLPVRRISSRMPQLGSSSMISTATVEIVCPAATPPS